MGVDVGEHDTEPGGGEFCGDIDGESGATGCAGRTPHRENLPVPGLTLSPGCRAGFRQQGLKRRPTGCGGATSCRPIAEACRRSPSVAANATIFTPNASHCARRSASRNILTPKRAEVREARRGTPSPSRRRSGIVRRPRSRAGANRAPGRLRTPRRRRSRRGHVSPAPGAQREPGTCILIRHGLQHARGLRAGHEQLNRLGAAGHESVRLDDPHHRRGGDQHRWRAERPLLDARADHRSTTVPGSTDCGNCPFTLTTTDATSAPVAPTADTGTSSPGGHRAGDEKAGSGTSERVRYLSPAAPSRTLSTSRSEAWMRCPGLSGEDAE